ncbi:LysR family transcriptional regulator [Vibrio sp. HN007]|uniref:LysR family transcriptional regulator n=1 Tax=Vibrio iocasae TaxID=3098914 RepID=UPI0035D43E94
MKDFNYNQLISFVHVAQCLNISLAAKQIGKNRATVSEHIDSLEDELGHKLFDRTSRQMQITPYGNDIYSPSALLLSQIGVWQNTVEKNKPSADKRIIRVAYDCVVPKKIILDLTDYCHTQNIDVEFILLSGNYSRDFLDNQVVDLIITPDEGDEIPGDFDWKMIGSMEYRFYALKNFFGSDSVDMSKLLKHTQLLPRAYTNKAKDVRYIFTPNNKIINDEEIFRYTLEKGRGWAFLPTHMHADSWNDVKEVKTKLGQEGFVSPIQAFWRSGDEQLVSPLLNYFDNEGAI